MTNNSSEPITEAFLRDALADLKREIFSSLHVAMPGTLVSFDPTSGTADIQPALRRRTVSGVLMQAPLLTSVPVFLPSSDFAPSPGDPCLLIFADFCIDGFRDTGQPVIPPSPRTHDLSDAFAFVGFRLPSTSV